MREENFKVSNHVVIYSEKSIGSTFVGVAKLNKGSNDKFDYEFGKALAYARWELAVRQNGIYDATIVCSVLGSNIDIFNEDERAGVVRLFNKHLNKAYNYLNTLRRYYSNQKKMVKYLENHGKEFAGLSCHEIHQKVHDLICK